ncbi:MAG: hypothetical protein ABI778_04305, partial [Ignavibacteriota bacterium]
MRNLLLPFVVALLLFVSLPTAQAQLPRTFSYQGVIVDPAGKPISDGVHSLVIKLYDASDAISPIFTETQTGVKFAKGLFNTLVGSSTPIPGTVAFDKAYFLGIAVDGTPELSPRSAVSSVPFALHSVVADALAPGAGGVV